MKKGWIKKSLIALLAAVVLISGINVPSLSVAYADEEVYVEQETTQAAEETVVSEEPVSEAPVEETQVAEEPAAVEEEEIYIPHTVKKLVRL